MLDLSVLLISSAGFIFFLFVHVVSSRMVHRHSVFGWLKVTIWMSVVVSGLMAAVWFGSHYKSLRPLEIGLATALTMILALLFVYFYVLYVFGPNQTSLRVKLMQELFHAPDECLTKEQLMERYSARHIIDVRINRLISNGDVYLTGQNYKLKKRRHFFFWLDKYSSVIERFIVGKKT